jgi:hypothetical protein
MKRKIRLTESQMVGLIKKALQEQKFDDVKYVKRLGADRQKKINDAWCSVSYGVVQNQLPRKSSVVWKRGIYGNL